MPEQELPSLEWFAGRAAALEEENAERNKQFTAIDQMIHADWEMPLQIKQLGWAFKQVELIFRQVIAAAKRILSDVNPKISIVPADLSQASLQRSDDHEKGLQWLLSAASRRREATIVEDVVESAIRYSEVAVECMFLPEQIKSVAASGGNPKRFEAMMRRGPFVPIPHHPGAVTARYSDIGPEEVCATEEMDVHDILSLYNNAELQVAAQEIHDRQWICRLRSYYSYDWRAVWVELGPASAKKTSKRGKQATRVLPGAAKRIELAREEWAWPFLPWVVRLGGSSLETRSDYKRRALLSDAYYGNLFETLNRIKTLRYSEMLRYAGTEKRYFQSGSREAPESAPAAASPMLHLEEDEKVGDLNPPLPDPGLGLIYAENRADVQKSTLSEVLFGGNIPAGAAFATINLVTHSALAVLKEPRRVAEHALADLLELFLLWAHYSETDLVGYGKNRDTGSRETYIIKWGDIDPKNLYIEVELSADVATDRQARMLSATQGVQIGLLSRMRGREEIGIHDSQSEDEAIIKERMADTMLEIDLQNERYMGDMALRDKIREQVMMEIKQNPQVLAGLLQEMMGSRGGGEGAPPGAPAEGPSVAGENGLGGSPVPVDSTGMGAVPGSELLGGMGGAIPAEFAPGNTREAVTGRTAGGEEIASV